jgi:hypothetical protein
MIYTMQQPTEVETIERWQAELRGIEAEHDARVRASVSWDARRTVLLVVIMAMPLWLPALIWAFAP